MQKGDIVTHVLDSKLRLIVASEKAANNSYYCRYFANGKIETGIFYEWELVSLEKKGNKDVDIPLAVADKLSKIKENI